MNVTGCRTDEITTIAGMAFQVGGEIYYFYFILSRINAHNEPSSEF